MADVGNYAGAVLLGTAMSLSAVTIVGRFGLGHSRSVYVIHALLLFLALIGSRLSFRFFDSFAHRLSGVREDNEKTRVLIYGAGRGGKFLVDEMMYNEKYAEFRAIGFVDDDPELGGQELGGLRIRGLASWFEGNERQRLPEVWISSSKITDDATRAELASLGLDPRLRRLHVSVSEVAESAKLE